LCGDVLVTRHTRRRGARPRFTRHRPVPTPVEQRARARHGRTRPRGEG
jgi:hypothetical protein